MDEAPDECLPFIERLKSKQSKMKRALIILSVLSIVLLGITIYFMADKLSDS
jgi:membrane protein involved in colicin uptake